MTEIGTAPEQNEKAKRNFYAMVIAIVLLGLALRLYDFFSTPLINTDGTYYIQQAKALYFGQYGDLTKCLNFLSTYPFFIVIGYAIFDDWVSAARSVSIFFSILAFFPLCGLVRRFFNDTVAVLSLLVFAVLPSLVSLSHEIIRGPVNWFFILTGLYLFVEFVENSKLRVLFLAALFFILGALTRIESVLFIITSALYLMFMARQNRTRCLLTFLFPFVAMGAILMIFAFSVDNDILELFKIERIARPLEAIERYGELRQHLKDLPDRNIPGLNSYFFDKIRNLVWLVALGTLIVQIVETLFYVFFLFMVAGIVDLRHQLFRHRGLFYLAGNVFLSLFVLYFQILYNWAMSERFVMLFLLPGFVFIGAGIDGTIRKLQNKFALSKIAACVLVGIFIFAVTLPKNARTNYKQDKLVFKQIGEFIAGFENHQSPVSIAGAYKYVQTIHFFSNLRYPWAPCFDEKCLFDPDNTDVADLINKSGCDFIVWDERNWTSESTRRLLNSEKVDPIELKTWTTDRFGRLVLYGVGR